MSCIFLKWTKLWEEENCFLRSLSLQRALMLLSSRDEIKLGPILYVVLGFGDSHAIFYAQHTVAFNSKMKGRKNEVGLKCSSVC